MLAGAVALAAGRFQPLVRLEPELVVAGRTGRPGEAVRYADVLTLAEAWRFARRVEARVARVAPRYDQLGDDCDFLTLAGDWPYRYDDESRRGPPTASSARRPDRPHARGGRTPGARRSRRRWAFTGRLLGDPAASVARAMGALFLQPEPRRCCGTPTSAGRPGPSIRDGPGGRSPRPGLGRPSGVYHAAGHGANLANWHRVMDPVNRFGLIWINSSGGPSEFSIAGGPGRPADLPGGLPVGGRDDP